jgi:hypothetical protein
VTKSENDGDEVTTSERTKTQRSSALLASSLRHFVTPSLGLMELPAPTPHFLDIYQVERSHAREGAVEDWGSDARRAGGR